MPGWDCHGLPIELKVDRQLGPKKREMSMADFRRACRAYAAKYVDIMREDFKRLGVFGTVGRPLPDDERSSYQAAIVRALGEFVEQGMVYKGKKPVHWCMHCRTALAEAEVEYEPHTSPSIYVEFPLDRRARPSCAAPRALRSAGRDVSVLIWTTTPWTIPSNLAIAFHPDFEYARLRRSTGTAGDRRQGARRGRRGQDRAAVRRAAGATFEGRAMERLVLPASALRRAIRSACSATTSRSTPAPGAVHTAPGHGADDYQTGVKYGLDIYGPVDAGRPLPRDRRALRRAAGVRRQSEGRSGARGARPPLASRGLRPLVSALLALPQPGDLPRDLAVVHRDGRRSDLRGGARLQGRSTRSTQRVDPVVGTRPDLQHDREPARLVHLAPARVGRADPGGRLHQLRRSRS